MRTLHKQVGRRQSVIIKESMKLALLAYARNEGKGASAVTCFIIFLLSCHAFWGRNLWGPGDMEIRGVKRMVAYTADLSQPKTSMEVVEVD